MLMMYCQRYLSKMEAWNDLASRLVSVLIETDDRPVGSYDV
jgi:hypothetical protein